MAVLADALEVGAVVCSTVLDGDDVVCYHARPATSVATERFLLQDLLADLVPLGVPVVGVREISLWSPALCLVKVAVAGGAYCVGTALFTAGCLWFRRQAAGLTSVGVSQLGLHLC